MENCGDVIEWLGLELSMKILTSSGNPSDLIRFSAVSTSWRHFVIENELSKQLCLKKFPELSSAAHVIEKTKRIQVGHDDFTKQKCIERNHIVYAYLCRGLATSMANYCISSALSASSTENYPEESIQNTLEPRELAGERASHWSSKGQKDPKAPPEKIVYQLISKLCIITEIHVQPFQAYFEYGFPIYSARAVRFRMGYPKSPLELENNGRYKFEDNHKYSENAFVWTYISPKFPMAQENFLQKFNLPEPVLCIGGILQVELLERVQSRETDGLYYICITHVQVIGRPLSPAFDVEILDTSGRCKLKYYPGMKYRYSPCKATTSSRHSSLGNFLANVRNTPTIRIVIGDYFLFVVFIFLLFLIKLLHVYLLLIGTS